MDPGEFERLAQLVRDFHGAPILHTSGGGLGYRCRVRLSVRGTRGDCRVGIFQAGSHHLVHIPDCPVHHPVLQHLLQKLVVWLNESGIDPYEEATHTGLLRAVQLALERPSQTVQVVLLLRDGLHGATPQERALSRLLARLQAEPSVHSLWLGALPHRNNSLFAERLVRRFGPSMVLDRVGGAQVYFPPDAFGQANPEEHDRAVAAIHEVIPRQASIVEYYAGVGTIGLGLAARGQAVTFNEVGPGSLTGLRAGGAALAPGLRRPTIQEGTAGANADLYTTRDTVIVDPPRKGLDAALLARLLSDPPERLVYLSCGLSSLLHEARLLLQSGKLALTHASARAYFPFTRHVETLLIWERRN